MRTSHLKTFIVYLAFLFASLFAADVITCSEAVASTPAELELDGPMPADFQTELSHDHRQLLKARTELSLLELKIAKDSELAQDSALQARLSELRTQIQSLKWKVGYVPPSTPYSKTIKAKAPKDGYLNEVMTETARRRLMNEQLTNSQIEGRALPGCAGNNLCQGGAN